jgi:hypothetical protein
MRAGLATVYDPALGMPPVRGATASARVASYSAAVAARSDFAGRVTARRRPPVHAEAIPA